ncbi:MAG: DUF2971 domain-containing protein [Chitinophagaceae bacterium]|nr:DUF2971 domain-containing protein [Chitinophagaceae bacterium]
MEFLSGIPQPLYKYRVWNSKYDVEKFGQRPLTHNQVYLASPEEFNDPFDGALPFKYREEDMTPYNIFIKLSEIIRRERPDLSEEEVHKECWERQSSGVFEDGRYWKDYYEQFKKTIKERFGILSLAEERDNILMWSHYADSHKGYCVGFDKELLFSHCRGQIGTVLYDDRFPELILFDDSISSLIPFTVTKSKLWGYEKEFRIVKIDGAKEVVTLPNEAVLEIILGCKMPEEDKKEIYKIAAEKFPHAKLFEAKINLNSFKLDLIPILKGG